MLLVILAEKILLEHSMEKNYEKKKQKEFRVEKVINRKGDKQYVKWKDNDSYFNSWIYKKDII